LKELSSNKSNKKSPPAATAKPSCSFWLVTIICLDHIPAWAPTTCNTESPWKCWHWEWCASWIHVRWGRRRPLRHRPHEFLVDPRSGS
jgi:hypothetical protein